MSSVDDKITANDTHSLHDALPNSTGTYYWTGSFSGDKNNEAASTSCKDAGESSVVGPAKPKITTEATASVTVGEKIKDTATIRSEERRTGEGKITFKLFSDEKCETEVTSSVVEKIKANGKYDSGEFQTKATGTYYWTASFSGDNNTEAASTSCKDAGESSVVGPAGPKITTEATASVTVGEKIKDTATISGLVEPTGEGKITFKLFSDEKCETEDRKSVV